MVCISVVQPRTCWAHCWRRRLGLCCLTLLLGASAPVGAAELRGETLRAYGEYIDAVRRAFEERVRTGGPLADIAPADLTRSVRDGQVLVQAGREDGILDVPGGLIHHWRGVAFIPRVTLQEALAVSQNYANYHRVYRTIVEAGVLERNGDTFRVRMRIQKSSGLVSAVLDVWSSVQYQRHGGDLVYSVSDSERITEVKNAGRADEERLPPDQGRGYLWRANTFSRLSERDTGVLVELENVGLSRRFPPMLGWIIEPIVRRIGRSSVEDSLVEFREAVLAAHRARQRVTGNVSEGWRELALDLPPRCSPPS
ncbi:MAG: hypothetical protein WBD07_05125 [Vicinamibacterales bacterium]